MPDCAEYSSLNKLSHSKKNQPMTFLKRGKRKIHSLGEDKGATLSQQAADGISVGHNNFAWRGSAQYGAGAVRGDTIHGSTRTGDPGAC